MMKIHHLLVATDLSPASAYAYPFAAGFARAVGAKVTLLFVDELARFGLEDSREAVQLMERAHAHQAEQLAKAAEALSSLNVEVRVKTASGVPSEEILATASRLSADAITVSMSGTRGLDHLLFGSTTRKVLRAADRPVLVVQLPKAGLVQPLKGRVKYRNLMVTTDFGADSERALTLALELAERINAEVALTHALRALPMPLPVTLYDALHELAMEPMRQDATAQLRAQARRHRSRRLSTRLLVGESVPDAIVEDADRTADMIIVPSHGRGGPRKAFLGNTAEGLLRRSARPTLVLPHRYLETLAYEPIA